MVVATVQNSNYFLSDLRLMADYIISYQLLCLNKQSPYNCKSFS